jgi:hypothetical protein
VEGAGEAPAAVAAPEPKATAVKCAGAAEEGKRRVGGSERNASAKQSAAGGSTGSPLLPFLSMKPTEQ